MKTGTSFWAAIMMALAPTGIARAGSATNPGPDKLHYIAQTCLTNKHAATNAVGMLKLDYYDQGKSLMQKLDLTATNLSSLHHASGPKATRRAPPSPPDGRSRVACGPLAWWREPHRP